MRILVFWLFIALLSLSCSRQWCYTRHPFSASVDTTITETVKDMPIYIPGDTLELIFPLEIIFPSLIDYPDTEPMIVENDRLKQQIQILDNKLHSSVQAKPIHDTIPIIEIVTEIKEIRIPEPVRYIPKIVKVFAWFGGGCVLLFIAWVVMRFGIFKI